jgi:hypothetical protein
LLRDSNKENWRDVQQADREKSDVNHRFMTVVGVCERNVECWLTADATWLATEVGTDPAKFQVDDPKSAVEAALAVTARDRQESKIIALIERAPLHRWLVNRSFEDFFDQLWLQAKRLGCGIPNLRDAAMR